MGMYDDRTERLATRILAVALVVALVAVALSTVAPIGTGEPYTEFYVLGPNGTASDYPETVSVGEPATVRVGVRNVERQPRTYTLLLRTNETTLATRELTLDRQEVWEEPVEFSFASPGTKRLHIELYDGETTDGEPYRRLRLFVEVQPA